MAVLHGLLLIAVIALMALMPCLLIYLICSAGDLVEGAGRALRRATRWVAARVLGGPIRRWQHVRLARSLRVAPALERSEPTCPPIEQVAHDLRRLSRQRLGVATRSPVWFTAVQRAYDDRLRMACHQLDIEQHLDELSGVDLDLERVRMEGALERAGLIVRDEGAQQR